MQYDIEDKVVVVTGAAQGIGRALALGLSEQGAQVAVVARDRARAQLVVDEMGGGLAVEADVSDEAAVRAAAAEVDAKYGRVDAVVANAGWMPGSHRVLDLDVDVLHRVLASNLVSGFLTTKHFAPIMIRGGGGRIVYMTSIAAVFANPGGAPYAAAKAGVNQLANIVHQELAGDGIRTVAIAPGLTETPGMQNVMRPGYAEKVGGAYPGGRVGQPEDLVGLTAFLCSDAAAHLSGTVITVRPPVNHLA